MSKLAILGSPSVFATLTVGNVPDGNYLFIDNDGFLQTFGEGRAWVDFNFGVGKVQQGASSPDLINLSATSIQTLGFNGTNTLEQVSVVLEMDHIWAEGTTIFPHVHWYPTTADQGDVKWQMEFALVATDMGVVPASTTISVVQAAGGVAWGTQFASFPSIATPGVLINSQLFIRFFRDPTDPEDTYGSDAAIATFGLHVLVDSLGSRTRDTK